LEFIHHHWWIKFKWLTAVINLDNNQIGFLLSVFAALATMLGWLIVAIKKNLSNYLIAIALLFAATAMILVSIFELIPTADKAGLDLESIVLWLAVGIAVVLILRFAAGKLESSGSKLEKSALLVAAALTLHNFPEGSVAISTTIVDLQSGLVSALAISLHNIPEGLAIAVTAVAAGMSARKVFLLVAAATISEILGACVVLYESSSLSEIFVAKLLTVVAGIMLTVAAAELIPHGWHSLKDAKNSKK
jgi:zinc transporter, ZIP family